MEKLFDHAGSQQRLEDLNSCESKRGGGVVDCEGAVTALSVS